MKKEPQWVVVVTWDQAPSLVATQGFNKAVAAGKAGEAEGPGWESEAGFCRGGTYLLEPKFHTLNGLEDGE